MVLWVSGGWGSSSPSLDRCINRGEVWGMCESWRSGNGSDRWELGYTCWDTQSTLLLWNRKGKNEEKGEKREGPDSTFTPSDLHKYIEFIEMSLGIATKRILAAYQPFRRYIQPYHFSLTPFIKPILLLIGAFIKIPLLIYFNGFIQMIPHFFKKPT